MHYMMSRHGVIPPSRGAFVFPLMAEKRRFLLSSGSIAPRRHTCVSAGRWPTSNLHNLSEGSGIFWGCQGLQQGSRPAEVQAVSTPHYHLFFFLLERLKHSWDLQPKGVCWFILVHTVYVKVIVSIQLILFNMCVWACVHLLTLWFSQLLWWSLISPMNPHHVVLVFALGLFFLTV